MLFYVRYPRRVRGGGFGDVVFPLLQYILCALQKQKKPVKEFDGVFNRKQQSDFTANTLQI